MMLPMHLPQHYDPLGSSQRSNALLGGTRTTLQATTSTLAGLPWATTRPAVTYLPPGVPRVPLSLSGTAASIPLSGLESPPVLPQDLLEGFPDPASVETQKMTYSQQLDDQLAFQCQQLDQQHQATLEFLREKNEQQKRHAAAAIDQQMMQKELELQTKYGEQMIILSQAAQTRKFDLEKQASTLTVEFNVRKTKEELIAKDYAVHMRYHEAASQPVSPHQQQNFSPVRPGSPGRCSCGTAFFDESTFCHKCGKPRSTGRGDGSHAGSFHNGLGSFHNGANTLEPMGASPSRPPSGHFGYNEGEPVVAPGARSPSGQFGSPRPSFHSDAPGGQARLGAVAAALDRTVPGALHLVIHGCYNLKNLDTGIMGDYSDPYVMAKVGRTEKKTATINNNLNPVWTDERFAFEVAEKDASLELEVFNRNNIFNNDSLGKAKVNLRTLPLAEWKRSRVKLENGGSGELEFDIRLEPKKRGGAPSDHGH